MSLTNLLGKKSRVLVLSAALTACGGDEEHNYHIGGSGESGKDVEGICRDVCTRLYQCDPSNESAEEICVKPCIDWNYPKDYPEWIDCVYKNECNSKLSNTCEKLYSQGDA